jgi:hypothetical protein
MKKETIKENRKEYNETIKAYNKDLEKEVDSLFYLLHDNITVIKNRLIEIDSIEETLSYLVAFKRRFRNYYNVLGRDIPNMFVYLFYLDNWTATLFNHRVLWRGTEFSCTIIKWPLMLPESGPSIEYIIGVSKDDNSKKYTVLYRFVNTFKYEDHSDKKWYILSFNTIDEFLNCLDESFKHLHSYEYDKQELYPAIIYDPENGDIPFKKFILKNNIVRNCKKKN